ncbi:hypothetical protein Daesc_003590 [Daldinia eschscholtzii]|uniref:Regulator of chromosome condensation n=1 Tax=Daldinia eschscholtzii TaxID=292717 RepID=A0AAX6MU40_9PEZI
MELFATGFNAWRQLQFDNEQDNSGEPRDLESFQSILKEDFIGQYDGCDTIHQYSSTGTHEQLAFPGMGKIVQLVAYETGFAALSHDGRVWTWGDERYSACLGRQVTSSR